MNVLPSGDPSAASASARISFFPSASGTMTAAVAGEDGGERLVHSRIDPLAEAAEWARVQSASCRCAVLVGAGMGYTAAALLEMHRVIGELWLLEAEPLLLNAAAANLRLAGTARALRFLPVDDAALLLSILLPRLQDPFSIHLSPSALSLAPQRYLPVVKALEGRLRAILLEPPKPPDGFSPAAALVERMIAEIGA